MRTISPSPAVLMAAVLMACSADGEDGAGADEVGDGDGDSPQTGDGDGDGDLPQAGDGDGDLPQTGDGDGEPPGDGDGDEDGEPSDCEVWEITYDLTGSQFEISDTPLGLGNQVNIVGEPYDAADRIGPGNFVLRFHDVDGAPGRRAFMLSHEVALEFEVRSGGVTVTTDLDGSAGPVECGITSGELSGATVTWMPAAIVGHRSQGQILCRGAFCRRANLPRGEPLIVDDTTDQPLGEFVFSDELRRFSMAKTVIRRGDNSTSSWTYEGAEINRELISAPSCLCED